MKRLPTSLMILGMVTLALVGWIGCESTDGGGGASGTVYYGMGVYDPWYYGDYHDDVTIVAPPPAERPEPPPRPTHPIAPPPPAPRPMPTPMPSIPSTPRPSFRR